MPLKNYTTEIEPEVTSGQVLALLGTKGARHVSIHYDDEQKPSGIDFMVIVEGRPLTFSVPCKHREVRAAIAADKKVDSRYKRGDFGRRIAWRLLKEWVEIQMAFVECGQAELAEVFLPYAVDKDGLTAYSAFKQNLYNCPRRARQGGQMAEPDDIPDNKAPEGVDWSDGITQVARGVKKEATIREVLDSAYKECADDIMRHVEHCARYGKPEAARVRQDMRSENGMRLMVVVYFVPPGVPDPPVEDDMPTGEILIG